MVWLGPSAGQQRCHLHSAKYLGSTSSEFGQPASCSALTSLLLSPWAACALFTLWVGQSPELREVAGMAQVYCQSWACRWRQARPSIF